jgi:hypothetical protein
MIRTRHLKLGAPWVLALLACARLAHSQTAAPAPAAAAATREANLRAYVELLRSDLRAQKVAVISEVMEFTEAEDAKFWPVYRQYEAELAKINDDRMALIKEYSGSYDALTDATADRLALRALDLESRRQTLTKTYYDRFKSVVSPKTAARFIQVEHQILLLLDLQIAASLPIASR